MKAGFVFTSVGWVDQILVTVRCCPCWFFLVSSSAVTQEVVFDVGVYLLAEMGLKLVCSIFTLVLATDIEA